MRVKQFSVFLSMGTRETVNAYDYILEHGNLTFVRNVDGWRGYTDVKVKTYAEGTWRTVDMLKDEE